MIRGQRSGARPPVRRGVALFQRALRLPPPVNGFGVSFLAPVNGFSSRVRRPTITVVGYSVLGTPVDIQIEWRTQKAYQQGVKPKPTDPWFPAPTYVVNLRSVASNSQQTTVPPADLAYMSWWYRARVGNLDTSLWSDWSEQRWLDITPVLGSVSEYLDINVGVVNIRNPVTVAYVEMNIGVLRSTKFPLTQYSEMNIGVPSKVKLLAEYTDMNVYPVLGRPSLAAYTDLNAVTDLTPEPHIWWIRPEQGKEGYVFNIYGHGFGAFQGEHDGKVQLGNLVCSIANWQVVPPGLVASTVRVSGKPRPTTGGNSIPNVLLNTSSVVLQAGDVIEYDLLWEVPSQSQLDIFPYFEISGIAVGIGASYLLNDEQGTAWASDQPGAKGTWLHRKFTIPVGHGLVGKTANDFGIGWYGYDPTQPTRTASVRSYVIRAADGTAKLWVTGDDNKSAPPFTYVANSGVLVSTEFDQEGFVIQHGEGLDPDVITTEHGWIVAIVPSGASSSMVEVVVEDS